MIIALGLRGYPRHVVPVPRVFREVSSTLEGMAVSAEDLPDATALSAKVYYMFTMCLA